MASKASTAHDDTLTEKQALAELVAWAADRPRWQQDALRRLLANGALQDTDIDELAEICLNAKADAEPVSAAHIVAEGGGEAISLLCIEDPTGINALAPKQKLEFAKEGLTIIYGDNGSGKSGYVRVLKHACRTRDRETAILRDIEDIRGTAQAAKLKFARGATEMDFDWSPNAKAHPELGAVSIFDSRSASIHVEKTNAVAYIPMPMRILEELATACDQIKRKLEEQIDILASQTPNALASPALGNETAAGAFVHGLSAKSNLAQLALLSALSEEESARLISLEADLAQDPKRAATRVSQQKSRLEQYCSRMKRLLLATSDAAFCERDSLISDRESKKRLSKIASDTLFAASPLPKIGEAIWQDLWEAARKYSNEVCYTHKHFPDAVAGDLCVLCQQPLSSEAILRRVTFEEFVKGTAKADEQQAIEKFDEYIEEAVETRIAATDIQSLRNLLRTEIGEEKLAAATRNCAIRASLRLKSLASGQPSACEESAWPDADLVALSASLASRAAQLSADVASPEYVALVREFAELKDRKALGPLVKDIKAEIGRLKQIEAIRKALKDTAKKSVTTKNKNFSDRLVSSALRGRFAREIEKMKLSRMPVELRKTKDQNAVSYFQVCLVEKPNEAVGQIFSEGEHRCVALAAFLAELVTSKRYSGIVFDDPMSSLDHIHRRSIAGRLVEEAEHRQVIVFTHDLTFLYELRREAEAKQRPVWYQTVRRKQNRPGYIDGELPNKAKSALQLSHALRSELKDAKGQFDTWADAKRTLFCKGFIEQLREAWDQSIADFVFPVLARFDNHIKGSSLFKLAVLTDTDVKTVTAARGRLSEGLHASAETLNPDSVTYAELFNEIGKLETWLGDILQRQKNATAPITSYVGNGDAA